jgi:uncharacterized membrane protein YbhN (UPF0104 family)
MKRLLVGTLLSVLVAGGLLWLTLQRMVADAAAPDQGVMDLLGDALRGVSPLALVVYGASFMLVHWARIRRWVCQVVPLGETDRALIASVCAVGYGAIVLFPWRLGELVRPVLLARRSERVDLAAAMGTAVTERVLDGLLITLLLFACVWTAPEPASAVVWRSAQVSFAVFVSALGGILLFVWQRPLARWCIRQTAGRVSAGLADRIEGLLTGFVEGMSSLRRSGALLPFLGWTALYWGTNALGIWWLAQTFGLHVPLGAGFGLLAVLVVGIMLPAGPGFLGNFQYFLGEGLRLYLPVAAIGGAGLAFSLTMNVMQLLLQTAWAVPHAARLGISVRGLVALQQAGAEGARDR